MTDIQPIIKADEDAVRECIKRDLYGAEVIRIKLVETDTRPGYWENAYIVAWKRGDEKCGTHRVAINSKGESMAIWGHYFDGHDPEASNAVIDFERRII